jgi:hypothetical protein
LTQLQNWVTTYEPMIRAPALASNNNSTNRAPRRLTRPLNTPIHCDARPQ